MQSFDIVRKSDIDETFRVARVMGDFDITPSHSNERFVGSLDIPDKWDIGVIFGASGTGKTTIAKELFGDVLVSGFEYKAKSVIDDMPQDKSVSEIEKMFYAVGFGSVPSWLKPYAALSNGEKMRVDLARSLLQANKGDIVVFDEFTSVVDRQVAQTLCLALSKAIKKIGVRFIAVSCHRDIIEYLQPDWCFCTDDMRPFASRRALPNVSLSRGAACRNGEVLGVITI